MVNLVDDLRHDAKRLGSVVVAALAARPFGIERGQPTRKGSRLTFARPQRRFQLLFEVGNAAFQFRNALGRRHTARTGGVGRNIRIGLIGIHAAGIIPAVSRR